MNFLKARVTAGVVAQSEARRNYKITAPGLTTAAHRGPP